jgi:pilus assembly protein Flp/PilA
MCEHRTGGFSTMRQLRKAIGSLVTMRFGDLADSRAEDGQTLIEYALILVLIAVVVIAVIALLGTQISSVFNNISNQL